jgi:hypothetical protein
MEQTLNSIQPYATVISSVLSLAALGFILRLSSQMKDIYGQRVEAAKDRSSVLEERLKLAEEERKRVESINSKVTRIGASLGIEEFKEELRSGVSIRDIGDNFSGKIAGRDIIDTINEIGKKIDQSTQNVDKLIDQSDKFINSLGEDGAEYEYRIDFIYRRRPQEIEEEFRRKAETLFNEGWTFCGIAAAYDIFDGCILIFRQLRRT